MKGKIKRGGTQLYATGVSHAAGRGSSCLMAFSSHSLRYTQSVFYKAVGRWSGTLFDY